MRYSYCRADEIALALIEACKLTGEDPLAAIASPQESLAYGYRARMIALEALREAFPHCSKSGMARSLGLKNHDGNTASMGLSNEKGRFGLEWPEMAIDEIIGSLLTMNEKKPRIGAVPSNPPKAVYSHNFGDPPPGRSALDQRRM